MSNLGVTEDTRTFLRTCSLSCDIVRVLYAEDFLSGVEKVAHLSEREQTSSVSIQWGGTGGSIPGISLAQEGWRVLSKLHLELLAQADSDRMNEAEWPTGIKDTFHEWIFDRGTVTQDAPARGQLDLSLKSTIRLLNSPRGWRMFFKLTPASGPLAAPHHSAFFRVFEDSF